MQGWFYIQKWINIIRVRQKHIIISMNAEMHLTKYDLSSRYDFVELTFVKWSTGCQMVSRVSRKDHSRNWNSEVYYSQALQKYKACLVESHREVSQGMGQAERQNTRHMPLLGSVDGVFWGSLVKAELGNSNKKEWCFLKLQEGFIKGLHRGHILGFKEDCWSL